MKRRWIWVGSLCMAAGLSGALWLSSRGAEESSGDADRPEVLPAPLDFRGSRTAVEVRPRALEARGDAWSRLNDEAIACLERGDFDGAIERFQRCRDANPGDEVFRLNLGEALARGARADRVTDLALAVEQLRRAVELAPERPELTEELAGWERELEAERGFWTDRSPHFELAFDPGRAELFDAGLDLVGLLEDAYTSMRLDFRCDPVLAGEPKIRVVLYEPEVFDHITGLSDWVAGAYDGTVRIPVDDLGAERAGLELTLRHELAHAFARFAGRGQLPGWLNEGLAQWLEDSGERRAADLEAARSRLARPSGLGGAELFPLAELQGTLATWSDATAVQRAYDQSLVLVGTLAERWGERLVYETVLACGEGRAPADEIERRTGRTPDQLLEELRLELGEQ